MAKSTRQQARDRINENDCSDRAVRQHIIANRNLKIDQMLNHAVIDSFVMATDNDKMRFSRELNGHLLIKTSPRRRREDNFRLDVGRWMLSVGRFLRCNAQILHCCKNRLRLHHHPLPSAKWRIINEMMFVCRPIAQIMNAQTDNSLLLRAFHDALAQRRATDFRKKRDDVDLH